ncbi:MAG: dTDP-4-dehydrorhamnose reductase [Dehalococcoidia bacterium]
MRVAVTGANGQLGCDVCTAFSNSGHEVIPFDHDVLDITDFNLAKAKFEQTRPHLLVNTAAMHNVEACETMPLKAFEVNGIGARNLALLANELDFVLFHISTDYVFDGKKKTPYIETDYPLPINIYGNSKLCGENFIRSIAKKYFVFRVSGLYGTNPCRAKKGTNFIQMMLKLAKERKEVRVVDDEVLTPTFTEDISQQIVELSKVGHYGLYHVTAQGSCSWYTFAAKIFQLTGTQVNLLVADPNEFAGKVARPKYSVLENSKLKELNMDIMPHWEEGLRKYLKKIGVLC